MTLLTLLGAAWAAGPWTAGSGHGAVHANYTFFTPYEAVAGLGSDDLELPRELRNHTVHLHGQVGLTDAVDAVAAVPVHALRAGDPVASDPELDAGTLTALGDAQVGAAGQLPLDGSWAVGGQLLLTLPTASYRAETGLRSGLKAWAVAPSVAVGHGWEHTWLQADVFASLPLADLAPALGAGVEGGVRAWDRLGLAAVARGQAALRDGDRTERLGRSEAGVYLDQEAWLVVGGKAWLELFGGLAVDAGAYKTITSALTPRALGVNAGVSFAW